jgi:hypothetical protein
MTKVPNNKDLNHGLEKEYCIAVAHKSLNLGDVVPLTKEDKIIQQHNRCLLLPDNEQFDFFKFVTNKSNVRVKKLISKDHFLTEGAISEETALQRCRYLSLSIPEKYVSLAKEELTTDRGNALSFCQLCLTSLIVQVAKNKGITYGDSPSKSVVSIGNIGIALTECRDPIDFEVLWDCMYGVFDSIPSWRSRLEDACLAQLGWKIDDQGVESVSRVSCIQKISSLAVNHVRRVVNGFAIRKKLPTTTIKRPHSEITAENRWKKRVKKEFKEYYVTSDNNVSILSFIFIWHKN